MTCVAQWRFIATSLPMFMLLLPLYAQAQSQSLFEGQPDWLDISGFGRIVSGYLDVSSGPDNLSYLEYADGELEFGSQSAAGLQFDARLTDTLGMSTQLLAHSGENRESGIEWLYLNYQPTNSLNVKLGKLRVPFFNYSDVLDVGYAYPWVSTPRQVYVDYLFSNYEGINAQYNKAIGETIVSLEAYAGQFDDDLVVQGQSSRVDVDQLRGIMLKAQRYGFTGRLAYHEGHVDTGNLALGELNQTLRSIGFVESANSFPVAGKLSITYAGISYHSLNYFFEGEVFEARSRTIASPDIHSFYFTLGYNFDALAVYATLARSNMDPRETVNEIPIGVSPQLDQLAALYGQVFENSLANQDDLQSLSLGLRWDFHPNMAFKVEVSRLEGEPGARSFFSAFPSGTNTNEATLFQTALEWVF